MYVCDQQAALGLITARAVSSDTMGNCQPGKRSTKGADQSALSKNVAHVVHTHL